MMTLDTISHCDCLEGLRGLPSESVDLVITDPPYVIGNTGGGFWSKAAEGNHYNARGTRKGMDRLGNIKDGFDAAILDELCRVMKKINIYIFCSQKQLRQYLAYFVDGKRCNWNLLTWHKSNPIPACGNKYLNDTEYILFFREKGVRLYGSYETKRTYYTTLRNQQENIEYGHPTVKPCHIIQNFIENSSQVGGVVLDPFIGSGTTAVAALQEGRHFVGFEIDKGYFDTAMGRVEKQLTNTNI